MEKTVSEAIGYRRSVRVFRDDLKLDSEKVRKCLENAVLAPTSSNLQLWEFYHVVEKDKLERLTEACLNQNAAKTAQQMVVVVSRKDLWRKRAKSNISFLKNAYGNKPEKEYSRREKFALTYYKKLIPTVYSDFLGILGWIKYATFNIIGLFKPVYRQVRRSDMRIVAHKSAGLAAENFMISMAAIGYDTCPMEGSDTLLVKRILNLPMGAEITMVVGCGIRAEHGIYGKRFRVPFEEVYRQV
ncbi:nitroreductase family protein [Flagellimonas sp.]|uniref:nitroreductase family protein n=1 Tax=Flagellimonas sp. TaxID=2058762 RepID=UPI003F4A7D74